MLYLNLYIVTPQVWSHHILCHGLLSRWDDHDNRMENKIQVDLPKYLIQCLGLRREMNVKENDQRTKGLDSLLNAETVKYFSMEDWETERYRKAIELYQVATLQAI